MKTVTTMLAVSTFAVLGPGHFVSEAKAAPSTHLSAPVPQLYAPSSQVPATLDCTVSATQLVPAFPTPYFEPIEDGDVVASGALVQVGFTVTNEGPNAANGLNSTILVGGTHPRVSVLLDESYTNDVADGAQWTSPAEPLSWLSLQDEVTITVNVDANDEFYGVFAGSPPASETCSLHFTVQ